MKPPPAEKLLIAPDTHRPDTSSGIALPSPPAAPSIGAAPGDLSAFLAARRRARGEPASPPDPFPDDEAARRNQRIAENIGQNAPQSFGYDPRRGGGVFQIQTLEFDYCEFVFFGWRNDIRRNVKQLIEVRRGIQPNIRIAVVRKMIEIIRDNEKGSFMWQSMRLGRNVTLSARAENSAELETFLSAEFFSAASEPR